MTALQELIDDIKANINGCYVNLNEQGLTEKERNHYNGAIIAGKDALKKATELLSKEREQIVEAWTSGDRNMYFRETGEQYYSSKYGEK